MESLVSNNTTATEPLSTINTAVNNIPTVDRLKIDCSLDGKGQESELISKTSTASLRDSLSSSDKSSYSLQTSRRDSLNSLLRDKEKDGIEATECTSLTNNVCAMNCVEDKGQDKKRSFYCGTIGKIIISNVLIFGSIVSFVFTPLDFLLWEKLNMRPGLPPFDWWKEPPDEVILSVFVFNVTNHERFMSGLDDKIHVEEIGPIVYLEKLEHYNVSFNENSTMTYTARRTPIFLPDRNTIDLQQKMIVPNLAVLGLASYLHDAPFLVTGAFRFMVSSHKRDFFSEVSIQQYLWDFRDPVLDLSRTLAPGLIPVNNMGMLARMYADFVDEITVTIGQQWGHERFFQLNRFRGHPQIPGYNPEKCADRVFGSTEGVMYAQRLTKRDKLLYWRKSACKVMPLYFDEEFVLNSIPVYRYNLSEQVFDRVTNSTDCYDSRPPLPDGLSDASKCYYDFPMVISYPHFYTGSPPKDFYVTGLSPDRNKHNSYVVVEPLTGTPLHSVARMQSNLRVANMDSFGSQYMRFDKLALPLFWAEYNQVGLPDYISKTIHFSVVILPPLQTVLSSVFLIIGCYILGKVIYLGKLQDRSLAALLPTFKPNTAKVISNNRLFGLEKDHFIARCK